MKVKTISRDETEHTRETTTESQRTFYNPDPTLHRFEKPREYVRALNAAKINNIYAQPFVNQLQGHRDTPKVMAFDPNSLGHMISGSCDGEIRIWDLAGNRCLWNIEHAHNGFVYGLAINHNLNSSSSIASSSSSNNNYDTNMMTSFYSCGVDKYLKRWNLDYQLWNGGVGRDQSTKPIQSYVAEGGLYCIDHHESDQVLVTGGEQIDVWDATRTIPKQSFDGDSGTGASMDTIYAIRFNRVQKSVVGYCCRDRSVGLYDIKSGVRIKSFVMTRKSNALCWNPMNPFHLTVANEDSNCYTYDLRMVERGPVMMHSGHTNAVMDIDYSPAGTEFVTGSYDKTIRIFRSDSTNYKAKEVYHTQRMQRVFSVKYSLDARYVFSGSDDHGIRVWKADRSAPLRPTSTKEQRTIDYNQKLLERYGDLEDIRKIDQHRHLPKRIYNEANREREQVKAKDRRQQLNERYGKKKKKSAKKIEKPSAMKEHFAGTKE